MSRRSGGWSDYRPAPRRFVEGGVVVAKPGKVSHPVAADLLAAAQMEAGPQFLARGRTYARAGQVMALVMGDAEITAEIQGTEAAPYRVRLFRTSISGADRVGADCTCPYGCDDGWCKHAAALAYVAAALLDREAGARARWTGESADDEESAVAGLVPASALAVDDAALAVLRSAPPQHDPEQAVRWAAGIVPLPPGAGYT
jgi:uncharacterized Zn finger protein